MSMATNSILLDMFTGTEEEGCKGANCTINFEIFSFVGIKTRLEVLSRTKAHRLFKELPRNSQATPEQRIKQLPNNYQGTFEQYSSMLSNVWQCSWLIRNAQNWLEMLSNTQPNYKISNKSFLDVYLNERIYWISPALLWNSSAMFILFLHIRDWI